MLILLVYNLDHLIEGDCQAVKCFPKEERKIPAKPTAQATPLSFEIDIENSAMEETCETVGQVTPLSLDIDTFPLLSVATK